MSKEQGAEERGSVGGMMIPRETLLRPFLEELRRAPSERESGRAALLSPSLRERAVRMHGVHACMLMWRMDATYDRAP